MEKLARALVIILIGAVMAVPFLGRWFSEPRPADAQSLELHARMPENGGWSLNTIYAQVGKPVTLRMTSDDVTHSFAIGQSGWTPVNISPGEWVTTTLIFDQPGEYTFYCTRWCGPNHWRMRGVIEVSGETVQSQISVSPLYLELGLDLDAPHPAQNEPDEPATASRGAKLADRLPAYTYAITEMQSTSPSALWQRLRTEKSLADLTDQQVWDAVAWIYAQLPGSADLVQAKELYQQNCQTCHGAQGKGDGVLMRGLPAMSEGSGMGNEAARPPDFSDPKVLLGASPALLEGKIIRGGMGTGMPNWAPIFTREQIHGLALFLYLFQMNLEDLP